MQSISLKMSRGFLKNLAKTSITCNICKSLIQNRYTYVLGGIGIIHFFGCAVDVLSSSLKVVGRKKFYVKFFADFLSRRLG